MHLYNTKIPTQVQLNAVPYFCFKSKNPSKILEKKKKTDENLFYFILGHLGVTIV
jgi:hypothetical protein